MKYFKVQISLIDIRVFRSDFWFLTSKFQGTSETNTLNLLLPFSGFLKST
jgi:hypothetical protein